MSLERRQSRSLLTELSRRTTIAAEGHAKKFETTLPVEKEPFKMSKFKRVPPKLVLPGRDKN
jgi:hypothetical protein